jgi:MFS family permease
MTIALTEVRTPLRTGQQLRLSVLWFAMFAQWLTVLPVILPDQVGQILGAATANREGWIGTIAAAGAIVALAVAPLVGAFSDRLQAVRGRRRPFLIVGVLGSCVSLLLLIPFDAGGSIGLYVVAIINLQFWWNMVSGAYAGLVPDVVPEQDQPTASGWLNVMTIAGTIVGNILVAATYRSGHATTAMTCFVAISVVCLCLTLSVHEPPSRGASDRFRLGAFLHSFLIDPRAHRNFYWVLVTRLLSNMGVWSVLTFLLSYLQDVIGVERPEQVLPMLLGAGAPLRHPGKHVGVCGLPTAMASSESCAWQAGSWRPRSSATCWWRCSPASSSSRRWSSSMPPLMAPTRQSTGRWPCGVLPSRDAAGKDMGVWHVSMVLPQILGPAGTGWLISWAKAAMSPSFAYVLAFVLAALWLVLAAALVDRIQLSDVPKS